MIFNIQNQDTWRTVTALRESIKFYNENNQAGKYNRALQKEQRMLKSYMDEIRSTVVDDKLGSIAA